MESILFLVGRILFGGVFLFFGINHFRNKKSMIEYAKSKNVSAPALANFMAALILSLSGVLLILGVFPDVALVLLIIFLVVVSLVMHDFWNVKDEKDKVRERIQFMMNVALVGASIMLIWLSHWPLSL